MDISKLEVGMRVQNYKELCSIIGEKTKTGNAKVSQIRELERYVSYRKDGFAFIIQEIYNIPKPKADARKSPTKRGNNSKYSKDIQALVINSLARATGKGINYPISQIITTFSLASLNYGAGRGDLDNLSKVTKIPAEYAKDFYMIYQAQVRAKIESALNSLRNRALIMWNRTVNVCILVAEEEYNELNNIKVELSHTKDTQAILKYRSEYRQATDEEKRYIIKIEHEVMQTLRCETLSQVFLSGQWERFSNMVNSKLLKHANIVYYYDTYDIVYNKEHIKKANLTRLSVTEKKQVSTNLNNNMGKLFLDHTTNLHNNAINKTQRYTFEELHASTEYPKYAKNFHDIIIKNNAKDIRRKLKNKKKTAEESKVCPI